MADDRPGAQHRMAPLQQVVHRHEGDDPDDADQYPPSCRHVPSPSSRLHPDGDASCATGARAKRDTLPA